MWTRKAKALDRGLKLSPFSGICTGRIEIGRECTGVHHVGEVIPLSEIPRAVELVHHLDFTSIGREKVHTTWTAKPTHRRLGDATIAGIKLSTSGLSCPRKTESEVALMVVKPYDFVSLSAYTVEIILPTSSAR
jgi:hypothetical protein